MGYTYEKHSGGTIENFWPDDDETTIYIPSYMNMSMQDILDKAKEKWGGSILMEEITIKSEFIHTACLGYDLMDWGDYTSFIVIERN